MTENKRFIVKDIWIKDNCIGALLNIDFNTINYTNLCCGLLNQIEKEKRNNGKLTSKLLEKNEQLKKENNILKASNGEYEDTLARLEEKNEQLKEDKQALIDFIQKEFPKSHKHILEGFE